MSTVARRWMALAVDHAKGAPPTADPLQFVLAEILDREPRFLDQVGRGR